MLAHTGSICIAQKANSTHITSCNLRQVSPDQEDLTLEEKATEYFQKHPDKLKSLENSEADHIASFPLNKRKRYKARRWSGHSYGVNLTIHTAYLFQAYYFAYGVEGKSIRPSKATLAKELGICIRTLDKALNILKEMEVLSWHSGQTNFETNTYFLADAYHKTPMRKPQDFKHPRHLWLKQQYLIKKQKLKEFTKVLFEHLLGDIADHLLRRNKFLRTSSDVGIKNILKTATDLPKQRKKPPNWHLLKDLKLSFKDQWVLSRYSEAVLRQALDDLNKYQAWGNAVHNTAAFLMKQCQAHQQKQKAKEANPTSIKEWLTSYFKARTARFVFISDKSQVDPATSDLRPFIQLLWHKQDLKQSILKVYQKVHGQWIDKIFRFDRTDLVEAIENYLDNSAK